MVDDGNVDGDDGDDDDNGMEIASTQSGLCVCVCEMFGKWAKMTPETKPKGHNCK